jgi:hypothetical protein
MAQDARHPGSGPHRAVSRGGGVMYQKTWFDEGLELAKQRLQLIWACWLIYGLINFMVFLGKVLDHIQ